MNKFRHFNFDRSELGEHTSEIVQYATEQDDLKYRTQGQKLLPERVLKDMKVNELV